MQLEPKGSITKPKNSFEQHNCDFGLSNSVIAPKNHTLIQKIPCKITQESDQQQKLIKPIKDEKEVLLSNVNKLNLKNAETFGGIEILNRDTCVSILAQNGVQLMVSTTFGEGKVVAFANDQFFIQFLVKDTDWIILLKNIVQWTARKIIPPPARKVKILFTSSKNPNIDVISSLKRASVQIQIVYQSGLEQVDISTYDCIFLHDISSRIFTESDCKKVIDYVRNGGGLVTALRGWLFSAYGQGRFMKDWENQCFYNKILIPMGLKFNQSFTYIPELVLNPQNVIELPQLPSRPYTRKFDQPNIAQQDKKQILQGLDKVDIGYEGHYGNPLSYYEENYKTILKNGVYDLCVAGRVGKGKIFAMGHNSIFFQRYTQENTYKRFIQNIVKWMCGQKNNLVIGLLHRQSGEWPQNFSFSQIGRDITFKSANKIEDLVGLDIVCGVYYGTYPKTMTPEFNSKVKQYVQNGGNFFFGSYGWVWQSWGQYSQNNSLVYQKDFASYVLLKQFNIFLQKGQFNLLSSIRIISIPQDPAIFNFLMNDFLQVLQKNQKTSFTATDKEVNTHISTIQSIKSSEFQLICSFEFYHKLVDAFVASRFNIEKNYNKLSFSDPFTCRVFNLMNALSYACPPQICRALPPSLNTYPGYATNKIAEKTIQVYRNNNKLVFTGLYLNPGEVVKVSHNHRLKDVYKVQLKINLNYDLSLYTSNEKLKRFTDVAYTFKIRQKQFLIASPHGGIIYFDVQQSNNKDRRPLIFKFQQAYQAPFWNQNIHSYDEFENIKKIDAPFIVIQTQRINLVCRTFKVLGSLKIDIQRLCKFWNTVMGYYSDYRGSQPYPFHKQAIFCDANTIAGYMHAGNPIMAHEDLAFEMIGVGRKIFYDATWGFYHEIGHNHQDVKWTMQQTGQITCNIYSLYLYFKMHGITIEQYIFKDPKTQRIINQFFSDPFRTLSDHTRYNSYVGLLFYAIIMDQLGYEVFSQIHKRYDNIKMQKFTNEYKSDTLVEQVSIVTNKNFWYYFKNWAMPVTERSLIKIGHLQSYKCKRYPFMTDEQK